MFVKTEFDIDDKIWQARSELITAKVKCGVCHGLKRFWLNPAKKEPVSKECPNCEGKGKVQIRSRKWFSKLVLIMCITVEATIKGGPPRILYSTYGEGVISQEDLFRTREECERVCQSKNAKEAKEIERRNREISEI
jgi:hypothetical protein